jgi:hypothetical protein
MTTEKQKLVAKIMKITKSKGMAPLDKLSDYSEEYLTELLRAIENLKK